MNRNRLNTIGYTFAALSAAMWLFVLVIATLGLKWSSSVGSKGWQIDMGRQTFRGSGFPHGMDAFREAVISASVMFAFVAHIGSWITSVIVWSKKPARGCLHAMAVAGLIPFGFFWGFVYLLVNLPVTPETELPRPGANIRASGGMVGP